MRRRRKRDKEKTNYTLFGSGCCSSNQPPHGENSSEFQDFFSLFMLYHFRMCSTSDPMIRSHSHKTQKAVGRRVVAYFICEPQITRRQIALENSFCIWVVARKQVSFLCENLWGRTRKQFHEEIPPIINLTSFI